MPQLPSATPLGHMLQWIEEGHCPAKQDLPLERHRKAPSQPLESQPVHPALHWQQLHAEARDAADVAARTK